MSVRDVEGIKVTMSRAPADSFWDAVRERYAAEDPATWKRLAMLALRENAGWQLDDIARVFGHAKGHVTRCLRKTKDELRAVLERSPELLGLDEDADTEGEA